LGNGCGEVKSVIGSVIRGWVVVQFRIYTGRSGRKRLLPLAMTAIVELAAILNNNTLMAKKMRVGVKAAWIAGICVILATGITAIVSQQGNNDKESTNQKVDIQTVNNDNSQKDIKNENNTFNNTTNKYIYNNTTIYKIDSNNRLIKDTFHVTTYKIPLVLCWDDFHFSVNSTFTAVQTNPFVKGDSKNITGKWKFNKDETEVEIYSDEFPDNKFLLKNLIIDSSYFQFDYYYNKYVFRRGFSIDPKKTSR
jgi:hypothetical protein